MSSNAATASESPSLINCGEVYSLGGGTTLASRSVTTCGAT